MACGGRRRRLSPVPISIRRTGEWQNACEIAAAAREWYERVVKSYNEAVGSFESRVRPGGEKRIKLGGGH